MRKMFSEKQIKTMASSVIGEAVEEGIDESISSGAIKTELDKKANLNGANFTGAITSPSIIENMSGYSYLVSVSNPDFEIDTRYAGCVKNGNKITFALVLGITRKTGATASYIQGLEFRIPAPILSIIETMGLTSSPNAVRVLQTNFLQYYYDSNMKTVILQKGDSGVYFNIYGLDTLTEEVEYTTTFECTLLLGDNLAEE